MFTHTQLCALAMGCFGLVPWVSAEIVTDGSVGAGVTLPGPHYMVDAALGLQVGGNLFHSFQQFSLATDEQATFSGPSSVRAVISRVTGGRPSVIQGVIRSALPGADFYFFNPAGWLFQAGGGIDISGSLHISTASELRFADGSAWRADVPTTGSVFSVATPQSFGFLTASAGDIQVRDTKFYLPTPAAELSFSAANIDIANSNPDVWENTRLFAPGGIALQTARTGEIVPVHSFGAELPATFPSGGEIHISGQTLIGNQSFFPGDQCGSILLRANHIQLSENSSISRMYAPGGTVRLQAHVLELDHADINNALTGSASGVVELHADRMALSHATLSSTSTWHADQAGGIHLRATDELRMIDTEINVASSQYSAMSGGNIEVAAGLLSMSEGSVIFARTLGAGSGGMIRIQADELLLSQGQITSSATSLNPAASSGNAGSIDIQTRQVTLGENGRISSETSGSGHGGNITLRAGNLDLAANSKISTTTKGSGKGGNIALSANGRIRLAGHAQQPAQISASSTGKVNAGNAGNITLDAQAVQLDADSLIKTSTQAASGGNIIIHAGQFFYAHKGEVNTEVQGGDGDGGNITITNPAVLVLNHAQLIARADAGKGGNILLQAQQRLGGEQDNILDASSRLGISGEVSLLAPQSEIGNRLIAPAAVFSTTQAPQACATRAVDTLENKLIFHARLARPPEDLRPPDSP